MDFSCVANCYLHKGKKEECVSNLVCLIIAQPKILKSGPCSLEALYIRKISVKMSRIRGYSEGVEDVSGL